MNRGERAVRRSPIGRLTGWSSRGCVKAARASFEVGMKPEDAIENMVTCARAGLSWRQYVAMIRAVVPAAVAGEQIGVARVPDGHVFFEVHDRA